MKLPIFAAFVVTAIVAAALFGAMHDQISFTVSNEYFTRFKFIEFRLLNSPLPDRIRVAEVGVLASWWMGIPLGVLCGIPGFFQRSHILMKRSLAWSLLLATGVTAATAVTGLIYGWFQTKNIIITDYTNWYIPNGLIDLRAYLCAGYMHNAAYLGAAISIPIVWVFHFCYRAMIKPPQ